MSRQVGQLQYLTPIRRYHQTIYKMVLILISRLFVLAATEEH